MGEFIFYREYANRDQFRINYPYYGLFGSADITAVHENGELIYKCRLLNGSQIELKKLQQGRKWIDAGLNRETPLSHVIGMAIDDFLKND